MVKYDYPYKKGVNITAWVLQFLVCVILIGTSAWMLWLSDSDSYSLGRYRSLLLASAGLHIAITAITLVLNVIEIILIARTRMPPWLYLTSACIKTAIWGVMFILNIVALSVISIILTLIMSATSIMQLIHGSIIVHRKRRGTLTGGNYAPAANPQGVEEGTYAAQPAHGYYYPPNADVNTEYKSPAVVSPPPQYGHPAEGGYVPQTLGGSYELDSRVGHN